MSLTAIQKLALSKLALTDSEKNSIVPGKHRVSFVVKVDGDVTVLDKETYTPTVDIPLIPTVALALKKMGVQREHFLKIMSDAMTEVLTSDKNMREAMVKESGLSECEDLFRAQLKDLPRKTRAGKAKSTVKVQAITL